MLVDDHLACGECQNSRTQVDDNREALNDLEYHCAAEHHDRDTDQQADHDQIKRTLSGARDAQHVVNSHQSVSNDDGLHRTPETIDLHVIMATFVTGVCKQLVGDPHQSQATNQHESGDFEQPDNDESHRRADCDRTDGTPDDCFFLEVGWELARGKSDHDSVIASENQIDDDDGQ